MMRYCKISLVVNVAMLLLLQIGCQEQTRLKNASGTVQVVSQDDDRELNARSAQSGPRITFKDTVYDFGEVSAGSNYTGQFDFTNTGDGILKIKDIKKCCGALVTLDKEELIPGESGTLKVRYYTGSNSGQISRQLHVLSNDMTNSEVTLDIRAKVVVIIDYQPKRIDLLLNKENADCPKITLQSLNGQPFSIKSFQSTGEVITADADPSVRATKFVFEPKVDAVKHLNHQTGFISISIEHPELDKITIQFRTKPRFDLKPAGLFLLNPQPKEPNINKVLFVNNYGEDFEIESTSSEKGIAKVIGQRVIPQGYRLEVEVIPPQPDETHAFSDVVSIRLKNGETFAIKCYGRYTAK